MSAFYDLSKTPRNILNQAIVKAIVAESNGLLFDPSDMSTMFQDAAGTVPVTAVEQPVGKIIDKSGNGNHATQSVTAYRPVLKQDANGSYYLNSDNVDDYLNLPSMPDAVTYTLNENGFVDMTSGTILGSTPILRWRDKFYGAVAGPDNLTESACNRVEYYLRNKSQTILDIAAKGINDIGEMGKIGFGVGICPALPAGYVALDGTDNPLSQNHGNYKYSDGSIQCWIPAFYARIGHHSNPTYATYGVNSVDIKSYSYFVDIAAANAEGYFLPRCFIDGGTIKAGFFIDKYMCSNSGGIASSIKNGLPLSSAADHNPFAGLTGAPSNTYAGAWQAAKTRGANFFVASRFIYAALALLSLAHGQAATSTTNCAWYDATGVINFPKGCNNALKDTNDTTVTYTSDGYSNCGKTGSGVPFAKTTHNGQACGIADLNGLMWEISQGVTCIAVGKAITAATQANPVKLTMTAHGMTTGQYLQVTSIVGMTQLNDKIYKVTVVDANNVTLDGVDGTAFTAYTSGGTGTYGTFYAAKESAVMANFTGGNTLASDHFGAVGVAANMDAFTPACFRTDYPNNGFAQKMGNSENQVLSPDLTGNNAVLSSLGVPIAQGASSAGSNLFGQDYLYQYIRNELCMLSGANWSHGSNAGVWAPSWNGTRTDSSSNVGFRSARYI